MNESVETIINLSLQLLNKASTTSLETSIILFKLSEDNVISMYIDLNGLFTWLTNGQRQLKLKFWQWTSKAKATACKVCGSYKLKGIIQS